MAQGSVAARTWSGVVRDLQRDSVWALLGFGLLNGSNYLLHVGVSRLLGPDDYGGLAALLAVVMVLSVPLTMVQAVVAKRTALLRAQGRSSQATLGLAAIKKVALVGLAAALPLGAFAPLLAIALRVDFLSAALLALFLPLALLASVALGVLQGSERFAALTRCLAVGALIRLVCSVGFVAAGGGLLGAMGGTVLSQGAMLWMALRSLGIRANQWQEAPSPLVAPGADHRVAFLTLAAFWALAEADVVAARFFLDPVSAGLYSSAGLIARALLFFPAAVSLVVFPRFSATGGRGDEARRWLQTSVAATVLLTICLLPLVLFAPRQVISLTFGAAFEGAAGVLPVLVGAMGLLGLVNLLAYFHVAAGSLAYRLIWTGVLLEAGLILFFHAGPGQLAIVVMVVAALEAAVLYHGALVITRRPSPSAGLGAQGLSGGPSVDLSLVLPCHNVGRELRHVLASVRRELASVPSSEIIVVSDGSTDETVRVAEAFAQDGVRLLHYPRREGKGYALRVGLAEARGRYVGFIDADGDISPAALRPFLEIMRLYEPDIVLGSKRHPLSEVHYPLARRIMSWAYHKLVRALFWVNVRDTQTGVKLIRREVLTAVLPLMVEKRYAFDLELLVVARSLGFRRVFEAPVRIDYRFSSSVDLRAVGRILLDTMAIFYRRFALGSSQVLDGVGGGQSPRRRGLAPFVPAADPAQRDGRLRILILNWRDTRNPEAGGAEVVTQEVAKRWVARGHEVVLLTSGFRGCRPVETVDGVRIRRMGRLHAGSFHALVQWQLARLEGFDVVIDEINALPFVTPLWRRRLPPTVALIHQLARDVLDAELPRPLAALGRRLEPALLRLYADVPVVTISESTRSDLLALGLRSVEVIPNGRDEPPNLEGVEKEPVPTFLFVGRLAQNKRPDHAVAAFRTIRERLPDARLWVVGRGPMEQKLRRSLPESGELLGFLPREELYRRMARAHCLLVPSVREGWGLAVIEANSVGTPAVAYDIPGIRDSVRHGSTGFLTPRGDPRALADGAVALVSDPSRYAAIQGEAISWAKRFSWDETAALLLRTIEATLDGRDVRHRSCQPEAVRAS